MLKRQNYWLFSKKNREQHKALYERAIYFWRKDFVQVITELHIETLEDFPENLEDIRNDCPVSCVNQYDDVIEMFEMGINDQILLTTEAYKKFCKDEWSWKSNTYGNYYYKNLPRLEEKERNQTKG